MPKDNGLIKCNGADLLNVLEDVEYMLISLRNIGNFYYRDVAPPDEVTRLAYAVETTRFLNRSGIYQRLERMKKILLEPMLSEYGTNGGVKLKRSLKKVKCWERPGD